WVATCVAIGLALIAFVIGADLVIRSTTATPETKFALGGVPERPAEPPPTAPPVTRPAPAAAPKPSPVAVPQPQPAPTEPVDPTPERVPEASYPADLEARFRPDWAVDGGAARPVGKTVLVRRIPEGRDPEVKP